MTSLKQKDRKAAVYVIFYLVVLDAVVFYMSGATAVFWFLTAYTGFYLFIFLYRLFHGMRDLFYKRLHAAYKADFERQADKRVAFEITPEAIIVREAHQESRIRWSGVRKLVLCPEYLFVGLDLDWVGVAKQADANETHKLFCDHAVGAYQDYAASHGTTAEICHSDWTIDLDKLKDRTQTRGSLRRILFSILWGAAFLCAGLFLSLVMCLGAVIVMGVLNSDADPISIWVAAGVLIIPLLSGLAGVVLGLLGKLPGTKPARG